LKKHYHVIEMTCNPSGEQSIKSTSDELWFVETLSQFLLVNLLVVSALFDNAATN